MFHRTRKLGRCRSERGQSLIETAVVLIPLMLLTFAIVDFASLFYVYLALENGVSQATRYAVTGQTKTVTDPVTGTPTALNRVDSIKKAMQEATPTLDINKIQITTTNLTTPSGPSSGGPGDIVRVTVSYNWDIITPLIKPFFTGGKINLTASSTMKDETW
jgi:Flp pilus assembly protein TadG